MSATRELTNFLILHSIQTHCDEVQEEAKEKVEFALRKGVEKQIDYKKEVLNGRAKVLQDFKLTFVGKAEDRNLMNSKKIMIKNFRSECNLARCEELSQMKRRLGEMSQKKKLVTLTSIYRKATNRKTLLSLFNRQIKQCAQDLVLYNLKLKQVASFNSGPCNEFQAFFTARIQASILGNKTEERADDSGHRKEQSPGVVSDRREAADSTSPGC